MGKPEGEQALPSTALSVTRAGEGNGCCFSWTRLREWVNLRCLLVFVLGCAVLLSAVFWLPFFHFGDHKALDLEYEGYDIVASFMLRKPAFYLEEQKAQLQEDIFNEISFSSTEVIILSLQSSDEPNVTKVTFAVEADSTTQSLIRSSFTTLITGQSSLHLTASLFGDPFSFEVLKFKGGLTVSPLQKAFLMQSVQIMFNFTLHFSVDEILENFDQLTSQLKNGLHLVPYENLYISLTNLKGSTVAAPTKIVSEVLLAVGFNPSESRLRQLTQTITGSHSENLGLNNTVFGRVKQISLSSYLQHSHRPGGSAPGPSPSSPFSSENHHHHDLSPTPSLVPSSHGAHGSRINRPTSAPAPTLEHTMNKAPPPQPCHSEGNSKSPIMHKTHAHISPSASPSYLKQKKPPSLEHSSSPVTSPQNFVHAHGHSVSAGGKHSISMAPAPGVSQVTSSSFVKASITSYRWTIVLLITTVLVFIAP